MRAILTTAAFLVALLGPLICQSYGQLSGVYEFTGGGDGFSWHDSLNWEVLTLPDGAPSSGSPATPPDSVTSADVPITGVLVSMPGQTALDVNLGLEIGNGVMQIPSGGLTVRDFNIGTGSSGANSGDLTINGGSLVAGDDITVGNGLMGTLTISSGMASTGDDFNINGGSAVSISGGNLNIGDRLNMLGNAALGVSGGAVLALDDLFFFEDAQVTVDSGSLIVNDQLRFDESEAFSGRLTINGGLVRSNEFGEPVDGLMTDFRGVIEINGDGVYQVERNGGTIDDPYTELTLEVALALIDEGVHLTTSEPGTARLGAREIIVPSFDGRVNVPFIEISVVPEPFALYLAALACAGLVGRWKRGGGA